MPLPDRWRSRLRTALAMAALCWARLAVAALPFHLWHHTIGGGANGNTAEPDVERARRFASHVDWAASLLPFATKCLPRAMALSWILRSRSIGHCVVFAARPPDRRGSNDELHAWVEVAGITVLGELPGPWVETLRVGNSPAKSM